MPAVLLVMFLLISSGKYYCFEDGTSFFVYFTYDFSG